MKKLRASLVLITMLAAMNASSVQAGQPHMQNALNHLRAARNQLQVAEHNKGGWRERALEAVNHAIQETENGMAAGRN